MNRKRWPLIWILLGISLPCGAPGVSAGQAADPLVVIVSKSNTAVTSLNKSEVKKILLGDQTTWANGSRVAVILGAPGDPDRAAILHAFCGMNESQFAKYQMQLAFTGGTPTVIKEVSSAAQIKTVFRLSPWALGFVREKDIDSGVKSVLTVD
jgi:hypothetical protein